ncbi:carboxylesterase family protein [Sarocladium implicatum]|nr:carboxylesterase family protein [Sarocladium implicatum]
MTAASERITIQLPGGPIRALSDGDIIRARGIRYATAARFSPPQPVTSWTEPRDCTQKASICPQNPSRLGLVNGDLERGMTQSEDCLHVSVAAPSRANNAPVMVFIHGGAWVSGGGDLDAYSPVNLAQKGVVAVNITHRLGVFGYIPIPGVAPANLGLLDQIEALRWVQHNISAFGGDSSNVTLFGQSAGGDAIFALAIADVPDVLFHRGILQSSPTAMRDDLNRDAMTKTMSEHAAQIVTPENASKLPVETLLSLTKDLLGVARTVSPALLSYGPILGSNPLPPADEAWKRFLSASQDRVFMFGYTANEDTAFSQIDSRSEATAYLLNLFQRSTDELADHVSKATGKTPPTYELVWHPEGSEKLKATHCIDLPMLLGDWDAWKDAPMLQGANSKGAVESIGEGMKNLWVAFARGKDLGSTKFVIDKDFTFGG